MAANQPRQEAISRSGGSALGLRAGLAILLLLRWLGYGSELRLIPTDEVEEGLGWAPFVAVVTGIALVGCAAADEISLSGRRGADWLFWICFTVIAAPVAMRVARPTISRNERIWLLNILGVVLYLTRVIASPLYLDDFDDYAHWSTAIDIMHNHHLFSLNALLPVSSYFPGLEIVTSAVSSLGSERPHTVALMIVLIARITCVSSVFLIFEFITGSAWIGSIGTLVYMGNSNFTFFLSAYSYETLAISFLLCGFFLAQLARCGTAGERTKWVLVGIPILSACAVSHHMTSEVGALMLTSVTLAAVFRSDRMTAWSTGAFAGVAVLSVFAWRSVSGGIADGHLGHIIGESLNASYGLVTGAERGRAFFVSVSGTVSPAFYRMVSIASVVLLSAGLVIGFFRALGLNASPPTGVKRARGVFLGMRDNPWAILLTLSAFGYPLSIALRLTGAGWEFADRMSAFVFLGVGLVVAVGAADVVVGQRPSLARITVVGLPLVVIVMGGIIAELLEPPGNLVASRYRPGADGMSIEKMGVDTARWTRDQLGEGQRFTSDRTNRLLLATFGRQRLVASVLDGDEPGVVVLDPLLSEDDRRVLHDTNTGFILVDFRLQRGLPLLGSYVNGSEDYELHKSAPLAVDLRKFDMVPNVGRIYDNGYEVIYDVRNLAKAEVASSLPSVDSERSRSSPGRVDLEVGSAGAEPLSGRLNVEAR